MGYVFITLNNANAFSTRDFDMHFLAIVFNECAMQNAFVHKVDHVTLVSSCKCNIVACLGLEFMRFYQCNAQVGRRVLRLATTKKKKQSETHINYQNVNMQSEMK